MLNLIHCLIVQNLKWPSSPLWAWYWTNSPTLLHLPLCLPYVLDFVVIESFLLLYLLWSCHSSCCTWLAVTKLEAVAFVTSEVVFDLNNLPAVLDLKLGHQLVIDGVLPSVLTHWTGLVGTLFEVWFCCSVVHDGASDPGKLCAVENFSQIVWSGVGNSRAVGEDFLQALIFFNHEVVVPPHYLETRTPMSCFCPAPCPSWWATWWDSQDSLFPGSVTSFVQGCFSLRSHQAVSHKCCEGCCGYSGLDGSFRTEASHSCCWASWRLRFGLF